MKYRLIFAYSVKTATIVQYLERIKETKKLEHKSKKTMNKFYMKNELKL